MSIVAAMHFVFCPILIQATVNYVIRFVYYVGLNIHTVTTINDFR
jgi:hypothetical protein